MRGAFVLLALLTLVVAGCTDQGGRNPVVIYGLAGGTIQRHGIAGISQGHVGSFSEECKARRCS